jgi:hypothetical protein
MAFMFGALPMLLLSPILAPVLLIAETANRIGDFLAPYFSLF